MNEILPAHNIGDYVPMIDGPESLPGRAKYTADLIAPNMLAGRIFRSPYSHAEILDVDISEAAKLPGVKAMVAGTDCDKAFNRRIGGPSNRMDLRPDFFASSILAASCSGFFTSCCAASMIKSPA